MTWAGGNEADIQAAQSKEEEQARIPGADEDEGWAQDAESSAQARPRATRRQDRRQVARREGAGTERLPGSARIRRGSEIRELLERGKRERTAHVDVFLAASPAARSRLGLIVPKHGNKIVKRNLVKRRLREVGRRIILPWLDGRGLRVDVLVRARRSAYDASFATLAAEVTNAVEGLWSEES